MGDVIGAKAPTWYRVAAVLGLIWNLIGVYFYLVTVGALPGGTEAAADAVPTWVIAAFAISVFSGALGSLGLVLLSRWAGPLLILSLLAVLVQDVWAFFLAEGADGSAGTVMAVVVTGIAILLVWLARSGAKRGWLG